MSNRLNIEILKKSQASQFLTLKRLGRDQFDNSCGFSKNVSSRKRVKHWFCVTFNIIIGHIFPENFIKIPLVIQKI